MGKEEIQIVDQVLEKAVKRTLQIAEAAKVTETDMLQLRELEVEGNITSLSGIEYAKDLFRLSCKDGCIDDLSPLISLWRNRKRDTLYPMRVELKNNRAKEVSFLEKIPDESGIQVYLYGTGETVEKAFEKYCRYDPVKVKRNCGNYIIYGKCELPWLFFENHTIQYVSENPELVKVWGPVFGESVEVSVGECKENTIITAQVGKSIKTISMIVSPE